ncbi:hypothetical protein C7999DRAFT_17393 [Corynascus novoguineensis]|uniref:FAD-binding PCMH-type domain-containing protein n=1 Tax=Corynascus novoguineensis TaxID=1126955 RepID=A0AAN7HLI6_9PEZI|nr:hypothetical protein C7999DRAFT_17393 [Corynascus novoguineensis]
MVNLRSALALGLAQLCHLRVAQAISPQRIVHDLQAQLSVGSEVVLTSNPSFEEDFTSRFSASHSPKFVVGAKPKKVSDVQKVIRYASKNKVPFLATGGGHGYTWTLGELENAIQLDLGHFQTIDINTDANTMTIGGAVRIGNVTEQLHAVGKEFPVGMCPTVGISGYTLGGGVGPLGGMYGAASDNLLSAEVVTGSGEVLTVSAKSHPDLWYGLRGAGFNYGVVTSMKYRIHPATNNGEITVINAMFPAALNGSVWEACNSFVGRHPKELSILFAIRLNETLGGISPIASFIYFGPRDEALKVVKPFLDLNPLHVEIHQSNLAEFSNVALYADVADIGSRKAIDFAPFTLNLYKVDVKNLVNVINFMNTTLAENDDLKGATLSWAQYPTEGFLSYPSRSSAFAYRDVIVYFSIDGFTEDVAKLPLLDDFGKVLRDMLQLGSGRPQLETYVHFGHGDEGPRSWYSAAKLPRLRALKRVYDPRNLFSWYNPVPSVGH